ncbi:ABC-2 transporter permease [Massilia sp. IC2-477]|uniref:ABC-2 transporter permease n=1 Tax=Massilia sp. IC2-477 TaxID=2887198 RepID=UPI001D11FF0A|nr:ABC-2 transporter permease [Massilia sp. IC2-477]MCC2955239.1 ABC-2 transporter permease [Massilia sp. IC2-477]
MKTMKWLLRREFWEHKGAFLWTPVAVAAAMILLVGGGFLYAMTISAPENIQFNGHNVVQINGVPPALRYKVAHIAASGYMGLAAPVFMVLAVVAFFYCLSALHDDRKDRSILFWKSLPLSDRDTVLSKVITAVCVVPLITIAIGTAAALVMLLLGLVGTASKGMNLFAPVLMEPNLYLSPLYLLAFLPVYILWALPTVGWLLLVSSWARSKVFLWAVGTPLVVALLLKWFNVLVGHVSNNVINVDWFWSEVVARGLAGLVPGIWFSQDHIAVMNQQEGIDPAGLLGMSYGTLATPGVWIAALVGVGMLYAAMRMRRWRDEG